METLTHRIEVFTDGSVKVTSPQPAPKGPSKFWAVKRDYEYTSDHRPRSLSIDFPNLTDKQGFPDTLDSRDKSFIRMDKALQFFWFENMRMFSNGMTDSQLKDRWAAITRHGVCWTDDHGTETYHDYVRKLHAEKRDAAIKTITCGGNILHEIGRDGEYIKVEAINPVDIPSVNDVNYFKTPWLVHVGTISTIVPYGGVWRSDKFPQFLAGVPFPLVGRGGVLFFEISKLHNIPEGASFPHPYNP